MRMRLWAAIAGIGVGAGLAACGGSDEVDFDEPAQDAGDAASNDGSGGASGAGGGAGQAGSAGTGGAPADAGIDATPDAAASCNLPTITSGKHEHQIQSSGQTRDFFVHVPPSYDPTQATMVVLVLHGYTETAAQIEQISQMSEVSDQHGFLAVYPQGISTAWNAGKCCGSASALNRPDVQFISDLLDELGKSYCVDPKRVYAAGFSNGGMLSQRLACELSHRIAAIGPVAGPIAIDGCMPTRAVPVIEFHGTGDLIVPYNGGGLGGADSIQDTIAFWAQHDGCTDAQPAQVYSNGDSSCVEYQSCAQGSAVRLCTVDGGGHQWPGGTSAGPAGKLTQDIEASEEMYQFFVAHPLP